MEDLLSYVFAEVLGNLFFQVGRIILRVVTFGAVRLENPTRFQMFIVALFGLIAVLPSAFFLLKFILALMAK